MRGLAPDYIGVSVGQQRKGLRRPVFVAVFDRGARCSIRDGTTTRASATEGSRDLSRGSRGGGSDPRDHDRPDPRDVFVGHVDLPRGRDREHVHHRGHDYTLRGSESRTLSSVGAFRVIPASDLRDTFDKPLDPRHGELWHLREAGLVQTVRIDRDNTVVTLTREGRDLLESRRRDKEHGRAIGPPVFQAHRPRPAPSNPPQLLPECRRLFARRSTRPLGCHARIAP